MFSPLDEEEEDSSTDKLAGLLKLSMCIARIAKGKVTHTETHTQPMFHTYLHLSYFHLAPGAFASRLCN